MSNFKQLEERIDQVIQSFKDQIIKGQFEVTESETHWITFVTKSGHEFRAFMSTFMDPTCSGFMSFGFDEDQNEFVRELFNARHDDHEEARLKAVIELKEKELEELVKVIQKNRFTFQKSQTS